MRIVVAGGSGFIGSQVVRVLTARGDEVSVLTRNASHVRGVPALVWDGTTQGKWSDAVAASDGVVNLAGASIGDGRWTAARKRELESSRIDPTRALVTAMRTGPARQRVLVNASAVGYYGFQSEATADESSPQGGGFLAELVARWEAAAREAESFARVVMLRFGVVLEPSGGALKKMLLPFRMGAGGPIGNGRQWMSWVSRNDVVRAIEWALHGDHARGIYNITSPDPVQNRDFARALGKALHRPSLFPVPPFVLRAAFGEMADELLIGGQRVVPRRALDEGFQFTARDIDVALKEMFNAG